MITYSNRSHRGVLIAAVIAIIMGACSLQTFADEYHPGEMVVLKAVLSDTLGNRYSATAPDSVIAWIFIAHATKEGDYWKREALKLVTDGGSGGWTYIKRMRCDSAAVVGDYWAEITAHDLHSDGVGKEIRTPIDLQAWRVTPWPAVEDSVWNALVADHVGSTTFGGKVSKFDFTTDQVTIETGQVGDIANAVWLEEVTDFDGDKTTGLALQALFGGRGEVVADAGNSKSGFKVTFSSTARDSIFAGYLLRFLDGVEEGFLRRVADYESLTATTGTIVLTDSLHSTPIAGGHFALVPDRRLDLETLARVGVIQITVTATHSGTTPVPGALIAVRAAAGAPVFAVGLTDAIGEFKFWRPRPLTTESLAVYLSHATTSWTVPETLVVGQVDQAVSYDGTDHSPLIAPSPDLKHVFGYWFIPGSDDGTFPGFEGITVKAELIRGVAPFVAAGTLSKYRFQTTTASTGRWDLYMTPNSDITPAGTRYRITIQDPEGDVIKVVTIPDTPGAISFDDL